MFQGRPEAGSQPGTLVIPEGAMPPRLRAIWYDEETIDEQDVNGVEDLEERPQRLWLDVQGIGHEETLRTLANRFSLHPLALEDVVHVPQRPKTELYDHQQFFISRMVRRLPEGQFDSEQISLFVGERYVITIQEHYGDNLDPVRARLRIAGGRLRRRGSDYLGYAIIDALVDGHYPIVEDLSEILLRLEDEVMERPTSQTLATINSTRRQLLDLRRGIWPQREAVNQLMQEDNPFFSEHVHPYLRDVHDHCVHVVDVVESYREIATGLLSTYLSSIANKTNDVMKVLTIMASIFIPLTFFAGIYGMNFDHMPELKWRWGYPVLLALMTATTVGMVFFFRRKGWIGNTR